MRVDCIRWQPANRAGPWRQCSECVRHAGWGKFVSWQRPLLVENDDKGIRMSFLDSRIDIGAIISAITHEHANRAIHLIEQRGNLRAVVDVTTGSV